MTLTPGARIGPYEILSPLGSGGMGEVYRARDTKLNRDVALKVLPESFASDPDRLARFKREAQVLASLNHPSIAIIHGLEHANGIHALVMELVEGEDLAQRLVRGSIPTDEALPIAKQIAEALEAAHEAGIIHRDLKPANIKVRPDGAVKVLDFGLAKALVPDAGATAGDLSQSPTITSPAATRMGVIMGTAAYMSPEQARGKPVDKRTDIWAFGCVLYEMLTSRRAFEGEDVSETLARILERVPDFSHLPVATPTPIRRLLRRCLQKDRRERLADIADARIEIAETASSLVAEAEEVRQGPGRPIGRRSWAFAAVALLALVSAFTVWSLVSEAPPSDGAVTQLTVGIEPAEQLGHTPPYAATLSRTAVALSPDGRRLVFAGRNGNQEQLYLRFLDRPEAQRLPGTEGGVNPFFSPDGEWVGFWAAGQLKKMALTGGPPVPLCETAAIMGASWGSNDSIVFARDEGGLWRVPAAGGIAERLTRTADVEQAGVSDRLPWVLPGGEAVLFTAFTISRRWEEAQIVAQSLVTGERRTVIEGGANPVYTPTGHIVYAKLGTLWAVPFDAATLTVTGPAAPVIESVVQAAGVSARSDDTGAAQFSISESGTLVYLPGGLLPPDLRTLVWVDRRGRVEPLNMPKGEYWHPRISPDGQRVAVSDQRENRISVLDLRRRIVQRLPGNGLNVGAWSSDGSRIAFGWIEEGGSRNLFLQPADGSGPPERLTRSPRGQFAGSWSADGLELLMTEERSTTGGAILALKMGAPNQDARNVLDEPFSEEYPALSPDGRWLAYSSNESGQYEVYVRAYPTLEGKQQVSSNGGYMPAWSPSGQELFYIRPAAAVGEESEMMAVEVAIGRDFRGGVPVELFRKRFQRSSNIRTYDVAPDGRFLVVERDATEHATATASLHIVLNWYEELKRLVPN